MGYVRPGSEALTDNAVLLSLWAMAQERAGEDAPGSRLKLMKLAFLATYDLFIDGVKAINMEFYRWHHGPMATAVYDSWGDLSRLGLMADEETLVVTDEGVRLAESFTGEVLASEENSAVLQCLQRVAKQYGPMPLDALLQSVYSKQCYTLDSPLHKQPIRSIELTKKFTRPLEEDEAKSILSVPPGWQITLELSFSSEAMRDLRAGIEDVHAGRVYGWEFLGIEV